MDTILTLFLIITIGLLIGRISVKNISFGSAAILLVALVFGHFGVEIPSVVQSLGLGLFAVSAGLMAGPTFFGNFKKKGAAFIILGVVTILLGVVATVAVCRLFKIPGTLAVGLFNGAMTSTPGLGAALEASTDSMISVGYGIAYPFGVVGVVLFIQLFPKLLGFNIKQEVENFRMELKKDVSEESRGEKKMRKLPRFNLGATGFIVCCVTLLVGCLIGKIVIPLPRGLSFTLGISGGPLFVGIVVGHFRRVGPLSLEVPKHTLTILRELGAALLLTGAGLKAGNGFVATVSEYGWILFVYGGLITIVPMFLACFLARKIFKLNLINTLGSICGGMSSSPALGALIESCETEDVVSAYAATYPFALVAIIIASQLMVILL